MLLVPNLKVQKELKDEKTITEYQLRQLIKGESQKFKDAVNSLISKSREFKIMTIEALTRRLDDNDMSKFCGFLNELKKMDMVEIWEVFERTSTIMLKYHRPHAIAVRVKELGPKLHPTAVPGTLKVKYTFKQVNEGMLENFKHFIPCEELGFNAHNAFRYIVGMPYQLDKNILIKLGKNISQSIGYDSFAGVAKELKRLKIYSDVLHGIAKKMASGRKFYINKVWLDWRGRAYSNLHQEVLSPIVNKWVRAALSIPVSFRNPLTKEGKLTIAQAATTLCGKQKEFSSQREVYIQGFKILNGYEVAETDFEKIWLNRVIREWRKVKMDKTHPWSIPVEIDQSASVCSYIGAITRNQTLLEITNTIGHNGISDPWTLPNIPRWATKLLQQIFYGSGQTIRTIIDEARHKDEKLEEISEQSIRTLMKELNSGRFKLGKMYAEACKTGSSASSITVNCGVDSYTFLNQHPLEEEDEEGRKRPVGIYEDVTYGHINPLTKRVGKATFKIMTKKVLDKDRIRSLYPTSLVHHLDAWTMAQVVQFFHDNGYWMIPNHDAVFCHPNQVTNVQHIVKECLFKIYNTDVLKSYLTSIGAANSDASRALLKEVKEPTLTLDDFMSGRPMK